MESKKRKRIKGVLIWTWNINEKRVAPQPFFRNSNSLQSKSAQLRSDADHVLCYKDTHRFENYKPLID